MKSQRIPIFSLVLGGLLLGSPCPVVAQTALCEITGEVADPTGAAVPGLNITLTNLVTGVMTMTVTSEAGIYYLRSLLPGEYILEAKKEGFKAYRATGITLVTGLVARQDFRLELGSTATSVE